MEINEPKNPRMPASLDRKSKPSNFCPGCGYGIVLKKLGEVIEDLEISPKTVICLDIGCNLLAWDYYNLDTIQSHHGRVTPLASGYKRANKESVTIGIAGDGGLYAIGLQSLLHTAHRNEPVTIIGINNTVYAMTGGQLAPTTLKGQSTDSSPNGKFTFDQPIYGPELVKEVADKYAFIARATVTNISELKDLTRQAIENQMQGNFSFLEVISYCPTNWKTDAAGSIEIVKRLESVYKPGIINGKE